MMNFNKYWISAVRLAAVVLCSASSASAVAETLDFGEMETGKVYSFQKGDEVMARFTSESGGSVKFVFTGKEITAYKDAAHTEPNYNSTFSYGPDGERFRVYQLSQGEVLHFYSSATATINSGTIMAAAKPETVNLVSTSPSLNPGDNNYMGDKFSVSTHYRMSFFFDETVVATSATLRFPDKSYVSIPMRADGTASIETTVNEQVMDAYRQGKIADGDTVRIRIVGIRSSAYEDVRYGTNGRLEVAFAVDAKPVELVGSTNLPSTGMSEMLSYYLPGDENGIITLEFDGPVSTQNAPTARINYGNPEDLEHPVYIEDVPVKVDGNRIIADLTGKRRRIVDMIPGIDLSSANTSLALTFGNIYSESGQRAYTGSLSSFSYFSYGYPIKSVEYVLASDFTPARGSKVRKGDEVEIWVMNGSKAAFGGLRIAYVKDGSASELVIPAESMSVVSDPESADDSIITFSMPDLAADEGSALALSLHDAYYADGLAHDDDVKGNYLWTNQASVESVEDFSDGRADVFSVTGVRVLSGANLSDLRSLPAGLYIFNGRKIVVK